MITKLNIPVEDVISSAKWFLERAKRNENISRQKSIESLEKRVKEIEKKSWIYKLFLYGSMNSSGIRRSILSAPFNEIDWAGSFSISSKYKRACNHMILSKGKFVNLSGEHLHIYNIWLKENNV